MRILRTIGLAFACIAVGFGISRLAYLPSANKEATSTQPQSKKEKSVLTIKSAYALRDGGIDATAALNEALKNVLLDLPPEKHQDIKFAIGKAIAGVLDETVNPAVEAFPELEPDEKTWTAVAKASAAKRAAQ